MATIYVTVDRHGPIPEVFGAFVDVAEAEKHIRAEHPKMTRLCPVCTVERVPYDPPSQRAKLAG